MRTEETASPKVSVIVPIYNAYDYLRPALDSILDQTLWEIEVICIDDGSTDRSLELIKEYQKADDRVRILTETNAGPALARNNGLRRARGEYVIFLDADDFFELSLLEQLYTVAVRDRLDIAIARYDLYHSRKARFTPSVESEHSCIFSPGKVTGKNDNPDRILQSTTSAAWNKLFRRDFILEKGIRFLEEVRVFEDVYFTTTALCLAERVGKVFDVLIHHRVYSEQARVRHFRRYYAQIPIVYLRIKEFMMQNGMYAPLSRGFLNLSASRCYKVYELLWADARVSFWSLLHNTYAEPLGWHGRQAQEFDAPEVCEFCASVEMYTHLQYLRRKAKGLTLSLERLQQTLRNARRAKRLRAFFYNIWSTVFPPERKRRRDRRAAEEAALPQAAPPKPVVPPGAMDAADTAVDLMTDVDAVDTVTGEDTPQ